MSDLARNASKKFILHKGTKNIINEMERKPNCE
jgi:hypothetical protein